MKVIHEVHGYDADKKLKITTCGKAVGGEFATYGNKVTCKTCQKERSKQNVT